MLSKTGKDETVAELVLTDLLPESIRILHKDYTLTEKSMLDVATDNSLGEVSFIKSNISYLPVENSETVDTIIHEVLHCLWRAFDIGEPEPDFEEHCVSVLSTGLTTVMRDNPELFPIFQRMLDE